MKRIFLLQAALMITFVLALLDIFPMLLWAVLPSGFDVAHAKLNEINVQIHKYHLNYLSIVSYIVFFILLSIWIALEIKSKPIKIIGVMTCLFMIIAFPTAILTPFNIYLLMKLDNPAFLYDYHDSIFPYGKMLENNYSSIHQEYIEYESSDAMNVPCMKDDIPGYRVEKKNHLADDNACWRALYLKMGGKIIQPMVSHFPITTSLLLHDQIHNAFFSILDPHVDIPPHTGYYKGYLRYHLGIIIPQEGDARPYIVCDGIKHEWKNGHGIVFDDMYDHYVHNPTGHRRVILFLDIKRTTLSPLDSWITDCGYYIFEHHPILYMILKDQHKTRKINS